MTGTLRKCSRCKGTGEARYNHMNGDTHCYLCNGSGIQRVFSAAEKALAAKDAAWGAAHAKRCYDYDLLVRKAVREATGETTGRTRRLATFWTNMVVARDNIEAFEDAYRAADAADRAERKAFAARLKEES
jgi:hypothetical protein